METRKVTSLFILAEQDQIKESWEKDGREIEQEQAAAKVKFLRAERVKWDRFWEN